MSRTVLLTVALVCALTLTASAAFNFTHGGIWAGYVQPEDPLDNTFGFGGEIGFGPQLPNVNFSLWGNYWSKNYTDDFTSWDMTFSDISVGVSGKYNFNIPESPITPYMGGGVGAHFFSTEIDVGTGSISDTESKFGVHVLGGISVPFSPVVSGFAEARYTVVDPDFFSANVGIRYGFGR